MRRNERGFTLVELLVTIAITGVLMTVLGTAIYQLSVTTEYGEGRATSLHELQNAAHWFNRDGQMAVTAVGGTSLVFTLPTSQTISYALVGTNLQRADGTTTMTLAQNITSIGFAVSGKLVTMNLTAAPVSRTDVSEQGTYQVYLRSVTE